MSIEQGMPYSKDSHIFVVEVDRRDDGKFVATAYLQHHDRVPDDGPRDVESVAAHKRKDIAVSKAVSGIPVKLLEAWRSSSSGWRPDVYAEAPAVSGRTEPKYKA